jgi:hypothetical protein
MGVLGNLGGGYGEEPVRVGDLEAAARPAATGSPTAAQPQSGNLIHKVIEQRQSDRDSVE